MSANTKWRTSLFLNVVLVAICGVLINENIKERNLVKTQSETIGYQMAAMELPRLNLVKSLRCDARTKSVDLTEMLERMESEIATVAKDNLVKQNLPESQAEEISRLIDKTVC